jgi:hypothetical protein
LFACQAADRSNDAADKSADAASRSAEIAHREEAAHDGELVPEHDDLEFLELLRTETQNQELEDKAQREVHER